MGADMGNRVGAIWNPKAMEIKWYPLPCRIEGPNGEILASWDVPCHKIRPEIVEGRLKVIVPVPEEYRHLCTGENILAWGDCD